MVSQESGGAALEYLDRLISTVVDVKYPGALARLRTAPTLRARSGAFRPAVAPAAQAHSSASTMTPVRTLIAVALVVLPRVGKRRLRRGGVFWSRIFPSTPG